MARCRCGATTTPTTWDWSRRGPRTFTSGISGYSTCSRGKSLSVWIIPQIAARIFPGAVIRARGIATSSLPTCLAQISKQQHAQDPNCDADGCVTNYLQNTLVDNPFYGFFNQVRCSTNPPPFTSQQSQVPLYYLLRPYPQFAGTFQALPNFGANSTYNSLQVRFQKRMNHYFSFEGNYTYSKAMDSSSIGANAFVGNLNNVGPDTVGNPQQLDRLNKEWAISANDATNRLVLAGIFTVPVGRGLWIGSDMNRVLDGFVGGWQLSGIFTYQTGQPLPVSMAAARLQDGNQRPNIICSQLGSGFSYHTAAANGLIPGSGSNNSVLNPNCFADPGDQNPGNGPRYYSSIRADGIHNWDLSFMKQFTVHEGHDAAIPRGNLQFHQYTAICLPGCGLDPGYAGNRQ